MAALPTRSERISQVLLVLGLGIVFGLATYGYRVMRTIGTRITALTPTSGFCATVAAALTVVLASRTAMPVSTTHIAVGAVMGVGLARGIAALDLRVIGSIFASWVVTLPAGGILAAAFFNRRASQSAFPFRGSHVCTGIINSNAWSACGDKLISMCTRGGHEDLKSNSYHC